MKTPNFWKDENCISFLLYPLSVVYGWIRFLHVLFSKEYRINTKIICIGNVTAGGAGKTPIAIKIGSVLKKQNINFAYLSKGYKGQIKEFTKVDVKKHKYFDVGDEPLLLAEVADTYICKNRKKAIEALSKKKYDLIIMDDGYQNPTIYKDKNILIIDGEYGIGNGELLPSGPLREPFIEAVKRANFVIIIGQDRQHLEDFFEKYEIKTTRAFIKELNEAKKNTKYIAFSGIARNDKFLYSLKKANYNVIKSYSFGDHYSYKEIDILNIVEEAKSMKAHVITTKKDWVKMTKLYQKDIEVLNIDIDFYNNDEFEELLLQ